MAFHFSILVCFSQVSFGNANKINTEWKFQKGDSKDTQSPHFDDSQWRTVDLPHDWSAEGDANPSLASCTGYLPGGIGWYRKELLISADRVNDKVYLYFEGVYNHSEVYLNGHLLGKRPNGYVSFGYDATPYIHFGKKNTVAVRVDHSKSADSRWYTGSGIYRNVWLVYANPVHFSQWGITCITKNTNAIEALLQINSEVENDTKKSSVLTLNIQLMNKEGLVVASQTVNVASEKAAKQTSTVDLKVDNPVLWNLDRPYLYTLQTALYDGNRLIDKTDIPVGIRSLTFDPDKGFALNGEWLKMKGVCIHHDAGVLGAAVPEEVWERRLLTLKQLGCNAIRLSHNPQAPELYALFDRLGFLVMDEAFDEWEAPKRKWLTGWNKGTPGYEGSYEFFNEWSERDLADMIRRDRNHPSIFTWSIGNEVDYPNDPYSHPVLNGSTINQPMYGGYLPDHPAAERLGTIAKRLVSIVKQYDTSRPVTAALAGVVMSNETEYPSALDIAGYNYTENRYDEDHKKYPRRIIYGSENKHSLEAWKSVRDNEFIFGQFLWSGVDYLGEAGPWPSRGRGPGLLDFAGFMKPNAYFRQSLWSSAPMIYIGTQRLAKMEERQDPWPVWNYSEGDSVRIVCFTNAAKVRLFLNGEAVGDVRPYDDNTGMLTWNIPFRQATLEAVGYDIDNHQLCRYSITSSQAPYAIVAKPDKTVLSAPGNVSQIEIQVVDKDGIPVFSAENEITCQTDGSVRFLGMEAGNHLDMTNYKSSKRKTFHGRLLCYIAGGDKKGTVTIHFSSPGLLLASVKLELNK